MSATDLHAATFTGLVNLADEYLGAQALLANDEFFAPKENLLKPGRGVFLPDEYTDRGKWMDGWESRCRREPGYDWCLIRLGMPGVIRGVVVDTAFFRGNYPAECSIEGCELDDVLDRAATWRDRLPRKRGWTTFASGCGCCTWASHVPGKT